MKKILAALFTLGLVLVPSAANAGVNVNPSCSGVTFQITDDDTYRVAVNNRGIANARTVTGPTTVTIPVPNNGVLSLITYNVIVPGHDDQWGPGGSQYLRCGDYKDFEREVLGTTPDPKPNPKPKPKPVTQAPTTGSTAQAPSGSSAPAAPKVTKTPTSTSKATPTPGPVGTKQAADNYKAFDYPAETGYNKKLVAVLLFFATLGVIYIIFGPNPKKD